MPDQPIHALVIDAGPLISSTSTTSLLLRATKVYTTPSVIAEIRDAATRSRLETTWLPFLQQRTPCAESVKIVSDFAKKTGDFPVLSVTDLQLLALTYELEVEENKGDWRLRKVPGQKGVNGPVPKKECVKESVKEEEKQEEKGEEKQENKPGNKQENNEGKEGEEEKEEEEKEEVKEEVKEVNEGNEGNDETKREGEGREENEKVKSDRMKEKKERIKRENRVRVGGGKKEGENVEEKEKAKKESKVLLSGEGRERENTEKGDRIGGKRREMREGKEDVFRERKHVPKVKSKKDPSKGENKRKIKEENAEEVKGCFIAEGKEEPQEYFNREPKEFMETKEEPKEFKQEPKEKPEEAKEEAQQEIRKDTAKQAAQEVIKTGTPKANPQVDNPALETATPEEPKADEQPSESSTDDSDNEGWITAENIHTHKAKDTHTPSSSSTTKKLWPMAAALATTDFAMQNVLLQMNLHLVSPGDLQRVNMVRTWVLRCHACFKICRDMNKQFCPSCGGATLMRTSCSTDSQGVFQIHLKKNMQWNNRGNVYSIPKTQHGSASGKGVKKNLILREDQAEYQREVRQKERQKERDLLDPDYLPGILTGERRDMTGARPRIGYGRVNPNKGKGGRSKR